MKKKYSPIVKSIADFPIYVHFLTRQNRLEVKKIMQTYKIKSHFPIRLYNRNVNVSSRAIIFIFIARLLLYKHLPVVSGARLSVVPPPRRAFFFALSLVHASGPASAAYHAPVRAVPPHRYVGPVYGRPRRRGRRGGLPGRAASALHV